ncbi:superoxide dismutase [Halomonas caseinilytica]|uniref:Superoxide dismutase n=1 Tax=Halomonas caseinilytica TaxID=438744 RepID=A0A1M6P804_9GAMM|nr:Fe-Mn family superoxide dismutase [Halomonas caseinilytica]SHK04064.1 superoxide dismutase, Fe-Mn family [Halomonas caseinilytica]
MAFELPVLPYEKNALEPYLSAETLEYHYGKHHQAYVTRLNQLVEGTEDADKSLGEIITSSSGRLFNEAAQVWNHAFYWHCLSPKGGGRPSGALAEAIDADYGSFEGFKEAFNAMAMDNFGSGWTWLATNGDNSLTIINGDDADCPVAHDHTPLLIVDVWEHAYYIDYRHARRKYLENIWKIMNWDFVAQNFAA